MMLFIGIANYVQVRLVFSTKHGLANSLPNSLEIAENEVVRTEKKGKFETQLLNMKVSDKLFH